MTIQKIREIVNSKVPGVGKGIVDYAIKNFNIDIETPSADELKKVINEILKHMKTFYGADRTKSLSTELAAFLPAGESDISI